MKAPIQQPKPEKPFQCLTSKHWVTALVVGIPLVCGCIAWGITEARAFIDARVNEHPKLTVIDHKIDTLIESVVQVETNVEWLRITLNHHFEQPKEP